MYVIMLVEMIRRNGIYSSNVLNIRIELTLPFHVDSFVTKKNLLKLYFDLDSNVMLLINKTSQIA